MSTILFGWDLLHQAVKSEIRNKQDILVSLTHLVLVSNGFKCIGSGESKILDGTETKSEKLPEGWRDSYAIRYLYQGKLYNLKGTVLDDGVMINFIRVDERTVGLVQLNNNAVVRMEGGLDDMIPENSSMADLIRKQLIDKTVISKKSREASSQTTEEAGTSENSRYHPENQPLTNPGLYGPPIHPGPIFNPGEYGRSDLDPFGGLDPLRQPGRGLPSAGGGMLFQPPMLPRPNTGIAPGSLPPGARFDPFRPDNPDLPRRPNRPDNDEMPPPGYDDMFM